MKGECEKARNATLSGENADAFAAHISKCPSCEGIRNEWDALKGVRGNAPETPPNGIRFQIRAAAALRTQEARRTRKSLRILEWAAAAAILLIIILPIATSNYHPGKIEVKSGGSEPRLANAHALATSSAWDSPSLDDGLLDLSSNLESANDVLSSSGTPSQSGAGASASSNVYSALSDFQEIKVEIPDLNS